MLIDKDFQTFQYEFLLSQCEWGIIQTPADNTNSTLAYSKPRRLNGHYLPRESHRHCQDDKTQP